MFILKLLRFLLKIFLKMLVVPILLFTLALQVIVNLMLRIGSLGITGIILIGIYSIIVGAKNKNWELSLIMGVVSAVTIGLGFIAGIIIAVIEEITSQMISFMFS